VNRKQTGSNLFLRSCFLITYRTSQQNMRVPLGAKWAHFEEFLP
jgi:hypothetical protein